MTPTITRHVQLQPHGERLLTASAAFWLFSARTLVLLMASAEAISWGYLGFLFGEGWARVISAIAVGTAVFMLVWVIDVSMLTMDRAWPEHSAILLGRLPSRWRRLKDAGAFGFRIVLLIGSVTVTAPYLSQLVFHRDIERALATEAASRIQAGRRVLLDRGQKEVNQMRISVGQKRHEYEMEVAGRGPSGKYGAGPASTALAQGVSAAQKELADVQERNAAILKHFDALAGEWRTKRNELSSAFNIDLPQLTVMETRKALDELRSRPENRAVELAVRMFLGFLFGGLLVLKLFEPSSVRLYFSEVLQQEYQRYLLGVFDSRLPTTEMSTKAQGRMSPQRFFAALVPVLTIERQEERQRAEDLAKATIRDSFDTIERLRQEACQDHDKQRLNVTELTAQVDNAVTSSRELETAMAAIRDDIEFFQLELERLDAADRQTDERSRFEYASYLSKRLKDARVALRKLEQTHPAETEKQRRLRSALDLAQRGLSEAERQVSKHERRARGLRVVIANEADRRVRATVN